MKLPTLFQEIIEHDKKRPDTSDKVVSINDIKDWRKRRIELTLLAEKFIRRQREGTA